MNQEEHLRPHEACAIIGVSERTLRNLSRLPGGPIPLRIGRSVRYRRSDLIAWLDSQRERKERERRENQVALISSLFRLARSGDMSHLEHSVEGTLSFAVTEDGQTWLSFEGTDGTRLSFNCFGFKPENNYVWSTGDITLYRVGGGDDEAR